MKEKVILAYSGGLDTSALIPWLKENFDYEVICVCGNCGQAEELDGLEERAISSGASKLYIEDLTDEFAEDFIMPCVKAHAVYENKYLLGTSMARPLIAKKLVEIALKNAFGELFVAAALVYFPGFIGFAAFCRCACVEHETVNLILVKSRHCDASLFVVLIDAQAYIFVEECPHK